MIGIYETAGNAMNVGHRIMALQERHEVESCRQGQAVNASGASYTTSALADEMRIAAAGNEWKQVEDAYDIEAMVNA
eukprot:CAMPEP_0119302488 /NCGR_PEP_ID=MMETSP1333-20130426/4077_1 /TAXON_ID=418940 /ORGANISM="Scyphosphaera apsteinii, Strain RCC1455" /LENGTH=76 /DNA_ID=CAMNT_0007304859 /DNA_START=58 /DNA_END=289 /DNA_ORIENTATION=-